MFHGIHALPVMVGQASLQQNQECSTMHSVASLLVSQWHLLNSYQRLPVNITMFNDLMIVISHGDHTQCGFYIAGK